MIRIRVIQNCFLIVFFLSTVGVTSETCAGSQHGSHLYPTPNSFQNLGRSFSINNETIICFERSSRSIAFFLGDELIKAFGPSLKAKEMRFKPQDSNYIFLGFKAEDVLSRTVRQPIWGKESYYLSVAEDRILVIGSEPEGQLHGVMTLLQQVDPETRTVPRMEIHDWPKMTFRGIRGHLPRNNPEEIENFRRIIRAMAFCKLNQLWIRDLYVRRFPASLKLDSHPEICDGDALPKNVAKELIEYAGKYNVKVMGSLAATADIVWSVHPDLIEMAPHETPFTVEIKHEKNRTPKYRFGSRFNFCPSREETYHLLFDLIDEMIPLFTSEVFDLGIDEVDQDYNGSRWVACNLCKGKDPVKLFADYVNRLADYVTSKGKIPLINNPSFIKGHAGDFHEIYKSISLIRKNIIINNWSEKHIRDTNRMPWNPLSRFKSSKYFKQYGLEKMIHLVGYNRRWKDRPELLETKGSLDCYGGCVTHYKYMTDGQFAKSPTIDDMIFSGNHFWNPNHPEMGSKEEEVHLSYAREVVREILEGKSFIQAATNARSILTGSQ